MKIKKQIGCIGLLLATLILSSGNDYAYHSTVLEQDPLLFSLNAAIYLDVADVDLSEREHAELQNLSSSKYYFNIGSSLPKAVTPKYGKYNLLETVQKGDLIYEPNGGFGITGHIAMVEGIFYDADRDITYIRVIEAIDVGVCRGVLDDTRVDDENLLILRVSDASAIDKDGAVAFCIGELGSSCSIDLLKKIDVSETSWHCSGLVWAAYFNQGINIERASILNEPGITPRDIYGSNRVYAVNY